jgi:DmsE family decaheme c-type cytochrome
LFERDPHRDAGLACAACHRVHDTQHRVGLLIDDEPTLCFSCHASQKGEFAMPTHHPVMEGVVRCSDCHQSVAQSAKQHVPSGPSETCTLCHAMFEGPYPFEHAAAVDYSTEEGGCLNCHAPHGAPNPRLLKQSYQAPDFALCSQCHSVPGHQFNVNHGSQWAGVPCADCHVDVHGSYDNAKLLDPSLQAQGCFVAGCHTY